MCFSKGKLTFCYLLLFSYLNIFQNKQKVDREKKIRKVSSKITCTTSGVRDIFQILLMTQMINQNENCCQKHNIFKIASKNDKYSELSFLTTALAPSLVLQRSPVGVTKSSTTAAPSPTLTSPSW